MSLETAVIRATNNADEFYKVNSNGEHLLVSHQYGEHCFILVCFDTECGCEWTSNCDLSDGETIKDKYPTAKEISKEEFEKLFTDCYNQYHNS